MKKIYFLLTSALIGFASQTNAQDCSGNRYYNPIFSSVSTTNNVEYGRNLKQDGTTEEILAMDIYVPDGDTETERPLVIFAHGGSFIGGNRADMAAKCQSLAKMGYVAASISYRLLSIDASVMINPGLEFQKEVVRAVHDMRAAVRFFRKSVSENGNPYGINPNLIIVGGVSAGAILANHAAYLDTEQKIPSVLQSYFTAQGGLEGNSGNPGYSSVPQMVVSLCGAISDTTWIETGDQPIVGVHNTDDNVVPNMAGQPNIGVTIPITLYGDSLIYKRTLSQNVSSSYMSVNSTGHCVFPPEADDFVRNFMHDQICVQHLAVKQNPSTVLFSVYPNPAKTSFFVDVPSNDWDFTVSVIDLLGKEVYREALPMHQNVLEIQSGNFRSGMYVVKITSKEGKEALKKIVIE